MIDQSLSSRRVTIQDSQHANACVQSSVDNYELVRELGGGGFSTVYLARDTVSSVDYAVKGLPPFVKNSLEELENIKTNFALVSRLSHTNIARAHVLHLARAVNYSSEDVRQKLRILPGDTMMVMEFAPGVTLSQWRKQFPDRKVPMAQALEITRQIASALDYAHEQNVLHRDIKPANVMIETRPDGRLIARVLDFGLAAEIRSSMGRVSREIHDTSGTRPYMAPEQWLGGKQGPATDQYALAVLFHELITGDVPFASVFDTGDPVVMMNVVGREPFVASADLPKTVRFALEKALAKPSENRFGSCAEFIAALEGKVVSRKQRSDPNDVKRGIWKVGALLACIAAIVIGAWWSMKKPAPTDEGTTIQTSPNDNSAQANDQLKSEVFLMKGKASQVRDRNEKEEWRSWPHFDKKAKDLESFYRAGVDAFDKEDYPLAKEMFERVRENITWLVSNKTVRSAAIAIREKVDHERKKAIAVNAHDLASNDFARATGTYEASIRLFEAGEFSQAKACFEASLPLLCDAASKAEVQGKLLREEKMKEDTHNALAAFREERWDDGFCLAQTADLEDASIQFALGMCYEFGYGVAQDESEAVKWFRKAAEQGDASAQLMLGIMYTSGWGVAKDDWKAVGWGRMEWGRSTEIYNIGAMCKNSKGVAKDDSEAVKWYRKAAEQGNVIAQNNLGFMYENDKGVAKDDVEAVKWYRKAAEQGNKNAQYNLGYMYENGKGVDMNISEAKKWYKKAADNGYDKAKRRLVDLADDIDILTADAEARYKEGLEMVGIDVEGTFRYGSTVRVSPGDNLPDILKNCKDKTTIILSPGEYKGNGSVYLKSKSVRICGDGNGVVLKNICLSLKGNDGGDNNSLLVVENMIFLGGHDKNGIFQVGNVRGILNKCVFNDCGLYIGAESSVVIYRTAIEGKLTGANAYPICFGRNTRGYISDTTTNCDCGIHVFVHDNSRLVIRNSLLKTKTQGYANYRVGIDFVSTNGEFFVENSTFNNMQCGIYVGNKAHGSVQECKFSDIHDYGIRNVGDTVEMYKNILTGTGKMFYGIVHESSRKLSINKNMLNR